MNIVTATDRHYMPGVLALLHSTKFHNPKARFFVLDMGISEKDKNNIKELCRAHQIDCKILPVRADEFTHLTILSEQFTHAIFARLIIPDILPAEVEKVIYLDADMVVTASLDELWAAQMNDALLAGVPDRFIAKEELNYCALTRLEYFNSGMLIFNLPLWRQEKTHQKIIQYLSEHSSSLLYPDQSAISVVCKNRVKIISDAYNIIAPRWLSYSWGTLPSEIKVLHFAGPNKPWKNEELFFEIFLAHSNIDRGSLTPLITGQLVGKKQSERIFDKIARLFSIRRLSWSYFSGYLNRKKRVVMLRDMQKSFIFNYLQTIS